MTEHAEMMMERLLGVESSATQSRAEEEKGNDWSEWKLWHRGRGLGSKGYPDRDVPPRPGGDGGSVLLDAADVLGKLRSEASTLANRTRRNSLAVYALLYLGSLLFFLAYCSWWCGVGSAGVSKEFVFVGVMITQNVWLLVSATTWYLCRRKDVDTALTSLVESYQPLVREAYGVELGYERVPLSPYGGWITVPTIYVRGPRRVSPHDNNDEDGDEEQANEAPHPTNVVVVVGRFPPMYVTPLISWETRHGRVDDDDDDNVGCGLDA